jgi:hypothetical protein
MPVHTRNWLGEDFQIDCGIPVLAEGDHTDVDMHG